VYAGTEPQNINQRIGKLIYDSRLNRKKWGEKVGLAPTVVYNLVTNERNKPSLSTLEKILAAFPEVSRQWLFNGEGAQYRNPNRNDFNFSNSGSVSGQTVSQVAGEGNTVGASEVEALRVKVQSLEEKVKMYEQMIEMKNQMIEMLKSK
jgi:hypothetical protein